jgi:hypothetical protein
MPFLVLFTWNSEREPHRPTATSRRYICRASAAGLSTEEAGTLEGWRDWIGNRWRSYIKVVDAPTGAPNAVPWPIHDQNDLDDRCLRKWAFVAARSRWPLLRNVVAETLRPLFEPQLVNQLPLPADPATLFELVCVVRILKSLESPQEIVRWLDLEVGKNAGPYLPLPVHG